MSMNSPDPAGKSDEQMPSKLKVLFWSRSEAIFFFEEGPLKGQTIRWCGEGLATGDFAFVPFAAKLIYPVSEEQVRGNVFARGIEVIRKLDESEHLVLMQALKDYLVAKQRDFKVLFF